MNAMVLIIKISAFYKGKGMDNVFLCERVLELPNAIIWMLDL